MLLGVGGNSNATGATAAALAFVLSVACGGRVGVDANDASALDEPSGPPWAMGPGDEAGVGPIFVPPVYRVRQGESPSCVHDGPGLSDCGPSAESCCASLPVEGGTFIRMYAKDVGAPPGTDNFATIGGFRLDKYDVTVGRFRAFVRAWTAGYRPQAGAGKHVHLNGGQGLANTDKTGGFETGWLTSDNGNVVPTNAALACRYSFDPSLYDNYYTWTDVVGSQETLPINCVNWYEAYAFCIWDGGFLPSDAEWQYAMAGGSQQRKYPWGAADPGTMNEYVIYDCHYCGHSQCDGTCRNASNIAPVGTPILGAGRWGQLDLLGNVMQWVFDRHSGSLVLPTCTNCACLSCNTDYRGDRGTVFDWMEIRQFPSELRAFDRDPSVGFRCARSP